MTFLTIAGSAAALLALGVAGTMLLPRHVHVERQALLDADARAVLALAASNEGYQRFNPYLAEDPGLEIEPFGPKTGVGSGFSFNGKGGKGTQTVVSVSPTTVRYAIDLGALGQPSQKIEAQARGDQVEVIWTMRADLGFNPIARVMGLFMDGMVGKTFETGLARLDKAV